MELRSITRPFFPSFTEEAEGNQSSTRASEIRGFEAVRGRVGREFYCQIKRKLKQLDQVLTDQLIKRINSERISRKLMEVESGLDFTLRKACELTIASENSDRWGREENDVNAIHRRKPQPLENVVSRQNVNVNIVIDVAQWSRFKNANCHQCGLVGHIKKTCAKYGNNRREKKKNDSRKRYVIAASDDNSDYRLPKGK